MAELPWGTVTFLFTDIEGSTRLLKRLGARYVDVLEDHRRIVRLLADPGIVRNRLKVEAAIANAKATVSLRDGPRALPELIWAHAPPNRRKAPRSWADVEALTPESTALAKELKRNGFRFVGPTTAYALMQACGLVNDHLAGCRVRADVERARKA